MERFLYRIYCKKICTYIEGACVKFGKVCFPDIEYYNDDECRAIIYPCEHQDWYIIEQCTGLKDKNGNLIYENDRVGFYVYGQDEKWHAQQGTVIWYNSCWGVETSSRFIQFENELTIKDPKDIEIVGNIHEQKDNK